MSACTCSDTHYSQSRYVAVKAVSESRTLQILTARLGGFESDALFEVSRPPGSPHCLPLLDSFLETSRVQTDGYHMCFVTPLYGGNVLDLSRAVRTQERVVPYALAKHILLHTLRGIAHAHSRDIIHTDIKADNVFFSTQWQTCDVEAWLSRNPPRHDPPEETPPDTPQMAVSQPLPMISVEAAMSATYVLADFCVG